MAILINFAGRSRARMTNGERRFADRLRGLLEDDYYCWYDVGIGRGDAHPDFIVLHPNRGLFVLEVKDWKLENIDRITKEDVFLKTQQKSVKNPLRQARDYAFAIQDLLRKDPGLIHESGRYQGQLIFPYGYGVVLTNIYRSHFEKSGMGECIEPHLVICQDEMFEKTDPLEFQERLWNLPTFTFGEPLTFAQIDRVRARLFPEITINLTDLNDSDTPQTYRFGSDLIRIMDIQQEQLARSLGEGHRVIHGVAGSGKTMILAFRCSHLVKELDKPVLVLCYNAVLATQLRSILAKDHRNIFVQTFHSWCSDRLWRYNIPKPPKPKNWAEQQDYYRQVVQLVIDGCNEGTIPTGIYGAVMIDEGQDFEPDWLRLVAQQVNAENDHFLLLYDDAQRLRGKRGERLSLKQLGIQASGRRTNILKLNYRNTAEILQLAYEFAQGCNEFLDEEVQAEEVPLIPPESCGRTGIMPELHQFKEKWEETRYIAQRAKQLVERDGVAWKDIAVLFRTKAIGNAIAQRLQQESSDVPLDWINTHKHDFDPQENSLKLITFDSSKGLEFQIVFICGLGELPSQEDEEAREARLVYVGMTRATDHLIMTCSKQSKFVSQIEKLIHS